MATEELILKLNNLVNKAEFPSTECEVVYFMVEIRKLLDRLEQHKKFGTLYFYCNWSMHITMHRGVVVDILKKISGQVKNLQPIIQNPEIFGLISFESLKKQIEALSVDEPGLMNWVITGDKWGKFKSLLLDVLINCPLQDASEDLLIEQFEYVKNGKNIDYIVSVKGLLKVNGTLLEG